MLCIRLPLAEDHWTLCSTGTKGIFRIKRMPLPMRLFLDVRSDGNFLNFTGYDKQLA
jgi:hypothetical protein